MANKGPAEYIIKLGTDIDNRGLNQIMDFFNTFRKSSLGATAAIVGATTALYKFIETTTKQEFELKKLAKTQGISIEQATKQKAVLDAMGKSLEEVRKDDKLNKTYQELTKINKELELPNASGALKKIEDLRQSFWQFKSAVNLTVTAIGRQLLINLEAPIKRITGGMNKISDWVRTKLNVISTRVSSVLTAFAKGIIGIAEVFGKVFNWISRLPSSIKAIAGAIGVVALALTAGPIGKILAAITFVGNLIHDYENFQWNKQNEQDTKFWAADNEQGWTKDKSKAKVDPTTGQPMAYKVPIKLEGAWEGYEENGIVGVADAIGNKIMEGLGEFDAASAGENFAKFIVDIFDKLTATVTDAATGKSVGGILGAGIELGKKIFEFLGAAIKEIAPTGASIGDFVNSIFTQVGKFLSAGAGGANTLPGDVFNTLGTVASGILDFIIQGLNSLLAQDKEGHTGVETFVNGLFDFIESAISDFAGRMALPEGAEGKIDVSGTISGIGQKIGDIIGSAIKIGSDFLGTFITNLVEWVSDPSFISDLMKIGEAILDGIIKGMGNIFDAIMSAIFGEKWANVKEKQRLSQAVEESADENGMVTWADGTKHSVAETNEVIVNSADAESAAKITGQENFSTFDKYKSALLEGMGIGGLTLRSDYTTVESGGTMTPEQAVARAYGLTYVNGIIGGSKADYIDDDWNAEFASLANKIAVATDEKSLMEAVNEMNAFMESNNISAPIEIDNAVSAAEKARNEMIEFYKNNPIPAEVTPNEGGGETTGGQALGGRFARRTTVDVGEDGTEYIIPITKPERAASLLKQMIGELGSATANKIFGGLGLGASGTNGANLSSVASAMSGMTMANTYNISAPLTINVNSSGADAKEIGSNVYSIAERRLIANLTGVCG